jgi:hypothetical protein
MRVLQLSAHLLLLSLIIFGCGRGPKLGSQLQAAGGAATLQQECAGLIRIFEESKEQQYAWMARDTNFPPAIASFRPQAVSIERLDGVLMVRVGDVCYALVGQVVNRSLLPVRYQPTAGLVVNSPLEEPSLTKQVRRDWGDIDATGHMRSLLSDAQTEKDDWTYGPALQRLRFYYPEEYQRQRAGALKKKIQKFESSEKKRR